MHIEVFTAWRRNQRMHQAWTLANLFFMVFHLARLFVESPWLPHHLPLYLIATLACVHLGVWLANRRIRQLWRQRARPQWRCHGRIAEDVLDLVHEGIRAARAEDFGRLTAAVERVRGRDDDTQREVLNVLTAVSALALYAGLDQRWPEKYPERSSLAKGFARYTPWLVVNPITVQVFLDRLAKPDTASRVFSNRDNLGLAFAVADWLLVDLPKPPAMSARSFLSEIEQTLQTGDGRLPQVWLV